MIPALGQERTKVDRIIVGGILFKSKLAKCPSKLKQLRKAVVLSSKKTKYTHSCMRFSLRCYVGNTGDSEPVQAAREELWGM